MAFNPAEVEKVAEVKRESLRKSVTSQQIDMHVAGMKKPVGAVGALPGAPAGLMAALQARGSDGKRPSIVQQAAAPTVCVDTISQPHEGDNVADNVEHMWDRMTEKGLSPSQDAELKHIRAQIKALTESLQAYKEAEMKILTSVRAK